MQALQEALFAGAADLPAMLERAAGVPLKSPGDPVACQNELRSALLKAGKPAYVPEGSSASRRPAKPSSDWAVSPLPDLLDGASPINASRPIRGLVEQLTRASTWPISAPERPPGGRGPHAAPARAGIALTVGTEHNTSSLYLSARVQGRHPQPHARGAVLGGVHRRRPPDLVARGETGYVDAEGAHRASPPSPPSAAASFGVEGRSDAGLPAIVPRPRVPPEHHLRRQGRSSMNSRPGSAPARRAGSTSTATTTPTSLRAGL